MKKCRYKILYKLANRQFDLETIIVGDNPISMSDVKNEIIESVIFEDLNLAELDINPLFKEAITDCITDKLEIIGIECTKFEIIEEK